MKSNERKRAGRKFSEALAEGVLELLLTVVALAVGYVLMSAVGFADDIMEYNAEILVLIGLLAFAAVSALASLFLRKICRNKNTAKQKRLDIIIDTDVGSDCDDMMALAYLVYAKRNLGVDIKAITHSNSHPDGIPAIRAFFRELGEDVPPIGHNAGEVESHDHYAEKICERFGTDGDREPTEDAVTVLRRALTESYDAVVLAVGPMTNIAALLLSEGDSCSSLSGVELVRERCKKFVLMAGDFESGEPEWNARLDLSATETVLKLCPVPLTLLPKEAGLGMITGAPIMEAFGEKNPLSLAFSNFPGTKKIGGRHSWDPAAAVFAIEGEGEFFTESESGTVTLGEGGTTVHTSGNDMHTYLKIKRSEGESDAEAKARCAAYIDRCAMDIYGGGK